MSNTPESDTMKTLTELARDNGAFVADKEDKIWTGNFIFHNESQLLATFNAWSAQQAKLHICNIVKRKDGQLLRSGCESYCAAIVISIEPFILVSQHADMRWSSTVKIEDFEPVGEATPSTLAKCMTRLKG